MADLLDGQADRKTAATMSRDELVNIITESGNAGKSDKDQGNTQGNATPDKETVDEGKKDEGKKDEPKELTDLEKLQGQVKKLNDRLETREKFVVKQSEEIGEMRRLASENTGKTSVQLKEDFNAKYSEDPQAAIQDEFDRRDAQGKLNELKSQDRRVKVKAFIEEKYPDFAKNLNEIGQLAADMGYPEESVTKFKMNPWDEDAGLLLNLGKNYELQQEKKTLEQRLDGTKTRTAEATSKIDEASRLSKTVTAKSGKTSPTKNWDHVTRENIRHMPTDELREFVKAKISTRVEH